LQFELYEYRDKRERISRDDCHGGPKINRIDVPHIVFKSYTPCAWRKAPSSPIISGVEDTDANQEALEQVQKLTDSEPVDGEELLVSEELKRQYREAKKRLEREAQIESGK
jgi:hypothetical protein